MIGNILRRAQNRRVLEIGGLPVRRIAFGTEQLGGYEWGTIDVAAIERALVLAVKGGATFFDTADCYGHGESERRLGSVLAPLRSNAFIATKFGVRFDNQGRVFYDNDPEYAERALDSSLARLRTDYVDLFQLHWPDGRTPLPALFERLERLREDERIRWYGVTNVSPEVIADLPGQWPGFATFSAQYSLAHRINEALICSLCAERGLTFLSWGSLAQGLLTGKYTQKDVFAEGDRRSRPVYANFHGEKLKKNLALVEGLRHVGTGLSGASAAQIAIRFVLEAISQSIAIVGVKNEQQLEENMAALSIPFSASAFAQLDLASQWTRIAA
jgi:aryl-alcohol dehydrogenase-like predicted oxidoreductase